MNRLHLTFENLDTESVIESEKALILLTIALTEQRFLKEKKDPPFWFNPFLKPKEFVQLQHYLNTWKDYEQYVVLPIFQEIEFIKANSHATIDYDVTFNDFKQALLSDDFEVIYLIAHHITSAKGDFIEFADGGESFTHVLQFLATLTTIQKKSIIFVVCESQIIENASSNAFLNLKSIGSASWKVPLIEGFQFIKHWVFNFNGQHTLSSAYSQAIIQFLNS